MTKQLIRSRMKELRNQLSAQEQSSLSTAIRLSLLNTEAYRSCTVLFSFAAFGSEVATSEILLQALKDQKFVYLPKVEADGMEFYQIQDLEGLIKSKFGVPEPYGREEFRHHRRAKEEPEKQWDAIMLLPGLAFDLSGNRIGYGAGYYDRYLHTHGEASYYKIALAYDFQVMEQLPADQHDIRADLIITPTRVIPCR